MKNLTIICCILLLSISCQKEEILDTNIYQCDLTFSHDSDNHPKAAKFQAAMEKVIELVPGVQIAMRSKDGNVWLGSQGFADIPNQAPFEKCTKTMIGSASKIYTAVLMMQLMEEGILSIDDKISDWLDPTMVGKIENAEVVTIKQMLNHNSGFRDYLDTEHHINSVNTNNYKLTPEEKLEYIYGKAAEFSPGDKYSYSNTNYVLLGIIIEKARNMTMPAAVEKYINEPLGLMNTIMGTSDDPIPSGIARPYLSPHSSGGRYIDVMQFAVSDAATGDGGIATNMQEAMTFIEAVFDHTLVTEASLQLMLNERIQDENPSRLGEINYYGLGLRQIENQYGLAVGHAGSTSAYWSRLFHFPDHNVTLAIAFNGDTEQDKEFKALIQLIFDLVDIAFE